MLFNSFILIQANSEAKLKPSPGWTVSVSVSVSVSAYRTVLLLYRVIMLANKILTVTTDKCIRNQARQTPVDWKPSNEDQNSA